MASESRRGTVDKARPSGCLPGGTSLEKLSIRLTRARRSISTHDSVVVAPPGSKDSTLCMSAAVGYEDIRGFKVATGRGDRQVTFHLQQHEELVVLGVEHHRATAHDWLSDVGEVLWPEQGVQVRHVAVEDGIERP